MTDVLFLAHSFPRRGDDPVGSFVLRLAVALREEQVRVTVVAPSAQGLTAREEFEGIPVLRFRYAPRRWETLAYSGTMLAQARGSLRGKATMASFLLANAAAVFRAASRRPPALLHAHWWFPGGYVGLKCARILGVPLVTTLHGSDIRAAQASPAATRMFANVLKRSTRVTTVSHWLADEARALVAEVAPVIAPMPVAPALFHPGASRARDRLLFVGKLNAQKGIEHLLRALSLMRARPIVDVVVGVGSQASDVEALATSLGVLAQLRFRPLLTQAELAVTYREATALVAPMTGEGLGLVAIEAALSGMPVVAFASGGLTDIVADRRTGLLVPPGDAGALAAALDELLAMPDQGAVLGAAGRAAALETFAPDAVARRYAALYREAIAPPRHS
jgi:glycosyltransferase involved in cell wall biosynthesis